MTPVIFPRRLPRGRGALLAVLALSAWPAAAQSLACGTFKDPDSGAVLQVESAVDARREQPGAAPEPYHLGGGPTPSVAVNLASGETIALGVSADGRYLHAGEDHYARESEVACKSVPPFAPGSCRADIAGCMAPMVWAGAERWRQWCREGVETACNRLAEDYRTDARDDFIIAQVMADPSVPDSVPAVCQEDDRAFDASGCQRAEEKARVEAVGKAFSMVKAMPAEVALSGERLDELAGLCGLHPSAGFCTAVSVALRTAGRLPEARRALALACDPGKGPEACAALAGDAGESDEGSGAAAR
ncbi:hypothetical protein [Stenotrophomonas sp.]|uniref:hypothetical protein n=1 Tax=Stenotrophomonas sp. TaxID=69392 RepID=UPI002FC957B4